MAEEASLMASAESSSGIIVRRGSVDSLSVYEITDYELEIFERGTPSSTYQNLAIFFVSVGISFLITLLTVEFSSVYKYATFLCVTLIGLAIGAVLVFMWRRTRSPMKEVCIKIRNRLPAAVARDSTVAASHATAAPIETSETQGEAAG
jgi:hypothetical protein